MQKCPNSNIIKTLDDKRKKFLFSIKKEIDKCKLLETKSTEVLFQRLDKLKNIINDLTNFETISPILNLSRFNAS